MRRLVQVVSVVLLVLLDIWPFARAAQQATVPQAPDLSIGPLDLRTMDIDDGVVTLVWDAPPESPQPAGYVVEGGQAPGEVLGALVIDGDATTVSFEAPSGTFLVRVRALWPQGQSAPSNEIRLSVGVAAPPDAPEDLLATADGAAVLLSWATPISGAAAERMWVHVAGAWSGVFSIPAGSESYEASGVPPGVYRVRISAEGAGGHSGLSNEAVVAVPGSCTAPQPPQDLRSWRTGAVLSVAWSAPASGAAVASYVVRVEGDVAFSLEVTDRKIAAPAPPGQYVVEVRSKNRCGTSAPVHLAPTWTAVTVDGADHVVHWDATPAPGPYRVFWSRSRAALDPLAPGLPFVDRAAGPLRLPGLNRGAPLYVRVFPLAGEVMAGGGPIATAVSLAPTDYVLADNVTPVMWDLNGDGCLDVLGGWGNCDGTFRLFRMDDIGLSGFTIDSWRKNSRIADLDGDGHADVFTNTYQPAGTSLPAVMFTNDGTGHFRMDPRLSALAVDGHGETALTADFDGDGDLDIFNPVYTHLEDGAHNWLLVNDGTGGFADVAAAAGVASNPVSIPEAAQALDVDADGDLDIHVGSRLLLNDGDLHFADGASFLAMPNRFDEGMRLFDVDLDGDLDLVHHDTNVTRLYRNSGGVLDAGTAVDGNVDGSSGGFGLNVCDLNGDGYEDVIVAYNEGVERIGVPHVLLNVHGTLTRSDIASGTAVKNDLLACGDLDGSGTPDVISRWTSAPAQGSIFRPVRMRAYQTRGDVAPAIRLRIVGTHGEWNQQGRLVRIRPRQGRGVVLTRFVESGSGYLAQNPYDLLVAAPWPGDYEVEVRFADGWVRALVTPGTAWTISANGQVAPGLR